jgi:hypothetical protein
LIEIPRRAVLRHLRVDAAASAEKFRCENNDKRYFVARSIIEIAPPLG